MMRKIRKVSTSTVVSAHLRRPGQEANPRGLGRQLDRYVVRYLPIHPACLLHFQMAGRVSIRRAASPNASALFGVQRGNFSDIRSVSLNVM